MHTDNAYLTAKRNAYQHVTHQNWPGAARGLAALASDARFSALDWQSLAIANVHAGSLHNAENAARRALAQEPDNFRTVQVLTIALMEQHRWAEASEVCAQYGDTPEASTTLSFLINHGTALWKLRRLHEALEVFLKALSVEMTDPSVHMRVGLVLKDMKLYAEAAESFTTAAALAPGRLAARLMAIHMRQYACDWQDFDAQCAGAIDLMQRLTPHEPEPGEGALFALLGMPHPAALFKVAAQQAAAFQIGSVQALPESTQRREHGARLRIGYLSCDFHNHATAQLLVEALEQRNVRDFEVTLYSHGHDDHTAMQQRVRAACEHFVDLRALGPRAMAQRIQADGIDVLVDLKGHTQDSCLAVMAYRAAPVQVSWLGFPGTSGLHCIDYFIGDPVTTPLSHAAHYTECIAQMPHCYQPNDSQRARPAPSERLQWGLPKHALVLGCFNQSFKLTPETFGTWMRILQAVPNAVLWMLYDNAQASANLRREAQARGVDPERLIFAPKASVNDHLARLPLADLMLDNWPCNAHTTASDALWMGVPFVTLRGEVFASRVCASLLHAVGLDELACDSMAQYEVTVIDLLRDPLRLQRLRSHLDTGRTGFPLFDGRRFAHDLEQLYRRMVNRARTGLPPTALPAADTAQQP